MLINEEVYKFEIWYIDHEKGQERKVMYSDSDNIFNLEGIPQTTYGIYVWYKDLSKNQQFWEKIVYYVIGDKITVEEAEEELKVVKKLGNSEYLEGVLEAFCKSERDNIEDEKAGKIYLNKNVEWDNVKALNGRILLVPYYADYKIISPSQIANGRVYPVEQVLETKDNNKDYNDKAYIDLE